MRLESPAFGQNEPIPPEYTCDGAGRLPPLTVSKVPEEAKSLAFVVDDPDAPGGDFVHWVAWNVSPDTAEIADAGATGGVTGCNSDGERSWAAPCPPSGVHRYFFKAYALDIELELPGDADARVLEKAMHGHVLDKAGLVGTYERPR
jgi:hypothetical protein